MAKDGNRYKSGCLFRQSPISDRLSLSRNPEYSLNCCASRVSPCLQMYRTISIGMGERSGERENAFPILPELETGSAMARTGKLSAVEVAKAKGPAALHDGGGLYLRVSATGAKSWVFRFQLDGKRRDMGLGPFPDISLADARGKATEHRKLRHDGIDPLDAKGAQR
jgi:hypothetical protein